VRHRLLSRIAYRALPIAFDAVHLKLFVAFSRAYPAQSALVLGSLVLASLAEGLGLTTLLPLLSRSGDAAAAQSGVGGVVTRLLGVVGLTPTVGVLLVLVVIGMTLKSVLVLVANKQVGYTVAHVATDLRLGFVRSLLSARWEYFLRQPVGALANSLATEATRSAEAYLYGATVIALAFQVIAYTIVALLVSWQATLAALAAGAVFVFLLNRLVHNSRRAGAKQTRLLRSLLARLSDHLQSVKPLKAMARENLANTLLENDTTRLNRALQKEIFSKEALRALQEPMLAVLIAVGLYVALVRFAMSVGSVMFLAFLLVRVLLYLGRMQREYQKMVTSESAYWSLQVAMEDARSASENPPVGAAPVLRHAIRLDDVGFRYRDRWILRHVAMSIPAGGITVIVGASGAGKTTVVDLVTALLRPQEGEVWIDELPLQRVDWGAWRRMIGYVPQDTLLLHDTVANNVTLGDPELTLADAEAALRAAGIWDLVSGLPEGLQTVAGERGGKLSGGQRQRVAIARALAHKPRVLILDEATSALDPETETAICRTLEGLRGDLTIIAISHQSPLVDIADRVYRLSDGTASLLSDAERGRLSSVPMAVAGNPN
jgi:ATP-binding cassette subfamily C protein